MSLETVLGGFAKSVALGQLRTALPAVGGFLTTIGVANKINAASLEGSIYYLASALTVIVPAYFSYLNKKNQALMVQQAVTAQPGTPEAAALLAKVT